MLPHRGAWLSSPMKEVLLTDEHSVPHRWTQCYSPRNKPFYTGNETITMYEGGFKVTWLYKYSLVGRFDAYYYVSSWIDFPIWMNYWRMQVSKKCLSEDLCYAIGLYAILLTELRRFFKYYKCSHLSASWKSTTFAPSILWKQVWRQDKKRPQRWGRRASVNF